VSPGYFIEGEEFNLGVVFHYNNNFHDSKFELGYKKVFDDHNYNTIGIVLAYQPIEKMVVNLFPDLILEGDHSSNFLMNFSS
jgi:hypothetical protein